MDTVDELSVSPSTIEAIGRCAYKWRWLKDHRYPPSLQFAAGRAVHQAAETYFAAFTGGVRLPPKAVEAVAIEAYHTIHKTEGVWLPPSKRDKESEEIAAKEADVRAYTASFLAWVEGLEEAPRLVEGTVAATVAPGVVLRGRLDMVYRGAILDLKTGARAWTQTDADQSIQMSAYACLARANGLVTDDEVRIEIVHLGAKGPKVVETRRTVADDVRVRYRAVAVADQIRAGVYPPATDGWWHSPEWCEAWYDCPYGGGMP